MGIPCPFIGLARTLFADGSPGFRYVSITYSRYAVIPPLLSSGRLLLKGLDVKIDAVEELLAVLACASAYDKGIARGVNAR